VVRRLVRFAVLSLAIVAAVVVVSGGLFTVTPTGFLPDEDLGAIFAVLQLP
jgi:HAE1 family hydrophobic/amphiphilic exporter-1